jgi:hypothetical protein
MNEIGFVILFVYLIIPSILIDDVTFICARLDDLYQGEHGENKLHSKNVREILGGGKTMMQCIHLLHAM